MEAILFRGKDLKTKEWCFGGYYHSPLWRGVEDDRHYILPTRDVYYEDLAVIEVDPETVGQYVCREDINRKKIFTGDIVKTYSRGMYLSDKLLVVVSDDCFTEDGLGRVWPQDTIYVEVVGNVYDNPELVGKKYADLYKHYFCFGTSVTRDDLKRNNMEAK